MDTAETVKISKAQNKTWRMQTHSKLYQSLCIDHLVQTTWFIGIYWSLFFSF